MTARHECWLMRRIVGFSDQHVKSLQWPAMDTNEEPSSGKPEKSAWQAAIDFGIDVSQVDDRLALTPAERIKRHSQVLVLVRALRGAGIKLYGFDPRPPETFE